MISVVLLNWKRPDNIKNQILPSLVKYRLINEIIISHGIRETQFDYESEHCQMVHRNDEENNKIYGLALRFLSAQSAKNDIVLILDDDLLPPEKTIEKLYHSFQLQPDRLHGIWGRKPDYYHNYNYKNVYGEVLISLTKCLLMPKQLATEFFNYQHLVLDLVKNHTPLWNGEDIFLSLVSIVVFGNLPFAYRLSIKKLPEGDVAINAGKGHLPSRINLLKYAVQRLDLNSYLSTTKLSKYDLNILCTHLHNSVSKRIRKE